MYVSTKDRYKYSCTGSVYFLPARKMLVPTCHCCSSVGSNKHLQKAEGLLCKYVSPECGLWNLDSESIHE